MYSYTMNEIQITDNALIGEDFATIKATIESPHFMWQWGGIIDEHDIKNPYKITCDQCDNYQLYQDILCTSKSIYRNELIQVMRPVMGFLNVRSPHRIKVNCQTVSSSGEQVIQGYHTDNPYKDCKTAILYLDDADGYTIFEHNNQKVYSKSNRIVTFPSHLMHSGTTPVGSMRRMVINFNYF